MQNVLLLWLVLSGAQVLLSSFNLVWFAAFLRFERSITIILLMMMPMCFMTFGIIHMHTIQYLLREQAGWVYLKETPALVMFLLTTMTQTAAIIWYYRRILSQLKEKNGRKQE